MSFFSCSELSSNCYFGEIRTEYLNPVKIDMLSYLMSNFATVKCNSVYKQVINVEALYRYIFT